MQDKIVRFCSDVRAMNEMTVSNSGMINEARVPILQAKDPVATIRILGVDIA